MKKIISLVMTLSMLLACAAPCFANEERSAMIEEAMLLAPVPENESEETAAVSEEETTAETMREEMRALLPDTDAAIVEADTGKFITALNSARETEPEETATLSAISYYPGTYVPTYTSITGNSVKSKDTGDSIVMYTYNLDIDDVATYMATLEVYYDFVEYDVEEGSYYLMYTFVSSSDVVILLVDVATNEFVVAVDKPDSVTGIEFAFDTYDMHVGDSTTIYAFIYPSTAGNLGVTYSSSNSKVVKMEKDSAYSGMVLFNVTALKAGTSTLTVKTNDGGYTAKLKITVTTGAVTGIELDNSNTTVYIGDTVSCTANALPTDAINRNITWKSSNTSVAEITSSTSSYNSTATVTAKATGTAKITATTEDGGYSKSFTLTVKTPPVSGIELYNNDSTVNVGESLRCSASVLPATAENRNVTWKSSNTSVAAVYNVTLSNGKSVAYVRGDKAGTAKITATTQNGSYSKSFTLTVKELIIPVESVELDRTAETMSVGEKVKLNANVLPANAKNQKINWTSGNSSVAAVSADGTVTAKATGTANITATSDDGSYKAVCKVTVVKDNNGITVSNNKAVANYSGTLIIAEYAADGSLVKAIINKASSGTSVSVTTDNAAKAMLWSSFDSVKPLSDAVNFN